ncbi:hypothetical protein AHF37_05839 [Paragonimus kellicotti]|nr:hypothetical protein AHF37_05839 [Paragonimus kellicotti]
MFNGYNQLMSTRDLRTSVVYRHPEQLECLQDYFPNAKILFPLFYLKQNTSEKRRQLMGVSLKKRNIPAEEVSELLYCRPEEDFSGKVNIISIRNGELGEYVQTRLLPMKENWAAYA